jgi:hypothetical protein
MFPRSISLPTRGLKSQSSKKPADTGGKPSSPCCLLFLVSLFGLQFDDEDGGDKFLQNIKISLKQEENLRYNVDVTV